jgi:hypothetical protein
VLLYDLAQCQQERAALAIDLARRTEKLKDLQKVVATLSFIRENNNQELLKCERRVHLTPHSSPLTLTLTLSLSITLYHSLSLSITLYHSITLSLYSPSSLSLSHQFILFLAPLSVFD